MRLLDVCNALHQGILILDRQGRVRLLNRIGEEILGITHREIAGKSYHTVFKGYPQLISALHPQEHKQDVSLSDNDLNLNVKLEYLPVRTRAGKFLGRIVLINDIRVINKNALHTYRLNRLATIGRLAAGIAHEVRNPLSGIAYILDELHDRHHQAPQQRLFIEKALREIDRLDQLVSGLLDFSRVDGLNPSWQNIDVLADEALLLARPRVQEIGVKIEKHYGTDLPRLMLDPEKIKQALLNLLLNSLDACALDTCAGNPAATGKTIRVLIRGYSDDARQTRMGSKFVEVAIEDNGRGIPNEAHHRIYDPFFTTKPHGTGLGLSIVYSIVEAHGGRITFDSSAGLGTRFVMYLPTVPPRKGGVLNVGIESEIDVLDPHRYGGWMTYRVLHTIFEGLVERDLTSSHNAFSPVIPGLARSWNVSADGRIYTFHLHPNVRFHDGTVCDAEAVRFNIDRMTNPQAPQYDPKSARYGLFIWRYLNRVQVLDSQTLHIHLREPFSDFLMQLTEGGIGSAKILSPAVWYRYGNSGIKDHPVGTGPFKLREIGRKHQIVLEKNHAYRGKLPLLDHLIFHPVPDVATRAVLLQSGALDLIFVPPPDTLSVLQKSGFKVAQGVTPHVWFISLNMRNRKMQDPRVRQAINLAIDKEGMARQLLVGTALPAYGLLPPGNPAYDPNFRDYNYDPDAARTLLKAAGYARSLKITLQTSTSGSGQLLPLSMAEWIQRDLEKVGITCRLDLHEWVKYIGMWARGMQPQIAANQISWGMSTDYWLEVIAHSRNWGPQGRNTGYYANPEVDRLLDRARPEVDRTRKTRLLQKANRLISADAAFVPIVNELAPICMNEKVMGFVHAPAEWYDFTTVWIADE